MKKHPKKTINLIGGLFSAGEQVHNLFLARALEKIGHTVILPQQRELLFITRGQRNLPAIVHDCQNQAASKKNIAVANLDGTEADSGGSVEYGIAITATGRAVVYRTDFRTDPEKQIGVNGMFSLKKTVFVFKPARLTDINQIEPYYDELAQHIDEAIRKVV